MGEMLREQQDESKSAMDALSATLLASVEANTSRTANKNAEAMRKMDTICQTRFFAIEATQREMCARLASLELAMEASKKQVVDLGGVVEVVSKSPAAEILESDAWAIEGPSSGRHFTLRVAGGGGVAARRVRK